MSARTLFCPQCSAYVPEGISVCACGFEIPAPANEDAAAQPIAPPPLVPLALAGGDASSEETIAQAPIVVATGSPESAYVAPLTELPHAHQPARSQKALIAAVVALLFVVATAGGVLIFWRTRSSPAGTDAGLSDQAPSAPPTAASASTVAEQAISNSEPTDVTAFPAANLDSPSDPPQPEPPPRSKPAAERPMASRGKAQAPVIPAPAPAAPPSPEPVADETASPAEPVTEAETAAVGAAVDQFNEVNDLIVSIERLSQQLLKAHEQEGRKGDMLWGELQAFARASQATRKEFRKATGTGIAGVMSNVTSIVRRNRGGREADSKVLRVKVEDLVRRADEIESLSSSAPLSATASEYWEETRRNLSRLASLLG